MVRKGSGMMDRSYPRKETHLEKKQWEKDTIMLSSLFQMFEQNASQSNL